MRMKFGISEGGGKSGGYTTSEARISRILKGVGLRVSKGDAIVEVETNKTGFEVTAPAPGIIVELYFGEGEPWNKTGDEKAGSDILYLPALGTIETEEENVAIEDGVGRNDVAPVEHAASGQDESPSIVARSGRDAESREAEKGAIPRAVPAARFRAVEAGISLLSVKGTGPDGIIQSSDIGAPGIHETSRESGEVIVEPSVFHQEMARRVAVSKQSIPHAGDRAVDADVTALWNYMEKLKTEDLWFRSRGMRPRLEHFIGYFAVELLKKQEFRVLNGYWDEETKRIVVVPHMNIGFAVDATDLAVWGDDRLGVPIVHGAETMSFLRFTESVESAIGRALSRKLTPDDDWELSFTINNTGVLGGVAPDSVIPITKDKEGNDRPTAMILNIGAVEKANCGWNIAFSFRFDHRVSGGRRAMAFARDLSERVASFNPSDFLKDL